MDGRIDRSEAWNSFLDSIFQCLFLSGVWKTVATVVTKHRHTPWAYKRSHKSARRRYKVGFLKGFRFDNVTFKNFGCFYFRFEWNVASRVKESWQSSPIPRRTWSNPPLRSMVGLISGKVRAFWRLFLASDWFPILRPSWYSVLQVA